MTSIKEAFKDGNAFMPFTVAGYPDKKTSKEFIQTLVDSGADVIELGIPFSDPMADGPTIMEADEKALEEGFVPSDVFDIASEFRDTPIVIMAYANTLHAYGYDEFLREAEAAGVNGLIIPDMPPGEFEKELGDIETSLDNIFLIAQNTPDERIKTIGDMTEGFAYLVSVKGTTGARKDFAEKAENLIQRTSDLEVPRAIGFGISSGEQARKAIEVGANGVIVGSALIDSYREDGMKGLENLATEINKAVKKES